MKKILQISILIFLMFQIRFTQAQGFWNEVSKMPENRYAHTIDELNGKIYVVGGMNNENTTAPTTALVYNKAAGNWSQISLFNNVVRWAHNSCIVDGKLYVVGGNNGIRTVATMEMLDPASNEWISKTSMPTDRVLAACAAIDDKIYIIGGLNGKLPYLDYRGIKTIEVYDTKNDSWTKLADMPTNRWGCSAVAFNGKIYVFGGVSFGPPDIVYSSVEVYDPLTNTWSTKSNMPTPRYCLSTCLLDTNIFVMGGWYNSSNGPLYDKVEVYNPIRDEWKIETKLPAKLAVLASIVVDGKIYVYGGSCTTHPLMGTSGIYELSYYDVFPMEPFIDKIYAMKGIDSVLFRTKISNAFNHQFVVYLTYINSDKTIKDSIALFDDGLHGDLLLNDGIYGGYILAQKSEDFYSLGISIFDQQTNEFIFIPDISRFTTAGPLKVESVLYSKGSKWYSIRPFVHNQGYNTIIKNVTVKLIINDPWFYSVNPQIISVPDIYADSIKGASAWCNVGYIDSLFPGYFNIKFEIMSNGVAYWTDSAKLNVTDIKEKSVEIFTYRLDQNYPNPFNPSTTLSFVIGHSSFVSLKVYDVLGREIETIVNEEKPAGIYRVDFDGSKLTSGIYFYRIEAGDFIQTRKMILLK